MFENADIDSFVNAIDKSLESVMEFETSIDIVSKFIEIFCSYV